MPLSSTSRIDVTTIAGLPGNVIVSNRKPLPDIVTQWSGWIGLLRKAVQRFPGYSRRHEPRPIQFCWQVSQLEIGALPSAYLRAIGHSKGHNEFAKKMVTLCGLVHRW